MDSDKKTFVQPVNPGTRVGKTRFDDGTILFHVTALGGKDVYGRITMEQGSDCVTVMLDNIDDQNPRTALHTYTSNLFPFTEEVIAGFLDFAYKNISKAVKDGKAKVVEDDGHKRVMQVGEEPADKGDDDDIRW